MAAFTFGSFNKERLFNVDTTSFDYTSLESLFEENGEDSVYQILGAYIGTKSQFDPETPLVAIDGYYVNIPVFQLSEVKAMLDSRQAIAAINAGLAGFTIEQYEKKLKKGSRTCYKAVWCDYNEDELE